MRKNIFLIVFELLFQFACLMVPYYVEVFMLTLSLLLWFPARQFNQIVQESLTKLEEIPGDTKLIVAEVRQIVNLFKKLQRFTDQVNRVFGGLIFITAVDVILYYSTHILDIFRA